LVNTARAVRHHVLSCQFCIALKATYSVFGCDVDRMYKFIA